MMQVRSDEIRRKLPAVVRAVERDGEHVELLRYDEPVAVIVPPEWHKKAKAALSEEHGIFVAPEWYEAAVAALAERRGF